MITTTNNNTTTIHDQAYGVVHNPHVSQSNAQVHLCLSTLSWLLLLGKERFVFVVVDVYIYRHTDSRWAPQ